MSDEPTPATTEPYVLDAIERENDAKAWPFSFGGQTYYLPSDFDMRAMAAFSGGRLDDAFRILMGEQQWLQLQERTDVIFGFTDLQRLMDAYSKALGIDLKARAASSRSSSDMPTPSKPTSPVSTGYDSLTSSLPAGLVRRSSSAGAA